MTAGQQGCACGNTLNSINAHRAHGKVPLALIRLIVGIKIGLSPRLRPSNITITSCSVVVDFCIKWYKYTVYAAKISSLNPIPHQGNQSDLASNPLLTFGLIFPHPVVFTSLTAK